ncbi:sarcosine oxidase subunit gamma [Nioella nitratireducens]|uniref:sarcosine oxidase subunit gamma n=1 Tax=Nioella nitratireducens TaxID=1287720 RepID=UPI0008FD465F|nr:sarcosine oxidase subunit gamma family protein [Nioella nitratireducens]
MSEVSALMGAVAEGRTRVEEGGLVGMITLRGDLDSARVKAAVKDATGLDVPGQRQVVTGDDASVAWMSPDELLIVVAHDQAPGTVAAMAQALADEFATVANVSDARALFRVSGPSAREAVAKLAPVDLHPASFGAGEMRRTRLAQVPAAIWLSGDDELSLICFRSVAKYVFGILELSAADGAEVGIF